MKIRIKDIAKRAGVSVGTVDRVLHNRGEVSLKTRMRIMRIVEEMQYKPDVLASSLASRNPFRVAVLMPFYKNGNLFWKEPMEGVHKACRELSYFRIEADEYLYDQASRKDFIEKTKDLLRSRPDAIITAPVFDHETLQFFDICSGRGIPFVSMNHNLGHPEQISFVGQDPHQSGSVAARLMRKIVTGNRRIAIVNIVRNKEKDSHILSREEGFRKQWRKFENVIGEKLITHTIPNLNYRDIWEVFSRVMDGQPEIHGIFVTSSRVYLMARFIRDSGIRDISLIGYDLLQSNIKYLKNETIDFLLSQKPFEQGYRSLFTIFNAIKMHREIPKEQMIPIDIICKENLHYYQH